MSQPLPLKEQIKALEHVQEIDLKIDQLKKSKGTLPAGLQALEDQLTRLKGSVVSRKSAAAEVEKLQRQTQAAMDLNKDRLARSTGRLESVQNTQEYQAATKEIEQLRKQKESLEEQAKKAAAELEAINKELAELQVNLGNVQQERDAQTSLLVGQTGKMEEEINALLRERAKFVPQVERRILAQYDRVRAVKGGLGIAPAVAGRCKGCNMVVPPQQFNEIQRGSSLHSCPSCHRILFVPSAGSGAEAAKG